MDAYNEMISVSPNGCICWNFSNHDAPRSMSRHATGDEEKDVAQARLLATVRQFLPGMDCLYQGEELGLTDAVLLESEKRDPAKVRCRDASRTPMPWEHIHNGGFTVAQAPWLPVPPEHLFLSVDMQEMNPHSLLHAYRHAHWIRHETDVLQTGSVQFKREGQILTIIRTGADMVQSMIANFSGEYLTVGGGVDLPPYGYICLQKDLDDMEPLHSSNIAGENHLAI